MAVDQPTTHMNMNVNMNMNLFREIFPNSSNNNNNQFFSNGNMMFPVNNESFQPIYNQNDVVYQHLSGKAAPPQQPAVKDDSGVTFNNNSSLIMPPTPQVSSRKRVREQIIPCAAPQLLTVNPLPKSTTTTTSRSVSSINLGDDLSLQIMQQQLELDRFISNHMEKMRVEIEEKKKQQMRRIMAILEEALRRRLREKDEELIKVGKINWVLEEKVKSLCLENQIWRDLAQTNEATANALRTNLEQVLEQMKENVQRTAAEVADDAVSCCGSSGYNEEGDQQQQWLMNNNNNNNNVVEEKGKSGWIYRGKSGETSNGNSISSGRLCRKCGEGESSVLLLPCRHLCLCTNCAPAVNSCPVCSSVKNASVHINLSSM